jgi:hypothetical protein
MHCPTCGTDTNLEQRFCRSCGMDLEAVSKLVAEHSSPEGLKQEKSLAKKDIQRRMYQSFKWGIICFILGMATLATTKTLGLDKIFNLGPLFLVFLGMGIMLFGALSPMQNHASRSREVPDPGRTAELNETEATKELPPARVPVPVVSITERTTQLIATEDMRKPSERS